MRKTLLVMKLIAAIGVGCAAPIQSPSQPIRPATTTIAAAPQAQMSSPAPIAPEASPAPTRSPGSSDAPLGSSVLLATWNDRHNQHELRPTDPRNGLPLSAYAPILLGRNYQYAFAPDGKALAIVSYPSDTSARNASLHLVDLQAWRDVTTTLKFDSWISAMTFSPDGSRLAVAYFDELARPGPEANTLMVIDLAAQAVVAKASPGFLPRILEYTPDGKSLIAYGAVSELSNNLSPIAHAAVMSVADLRIEWTLPLPRIKDGQYQVAEGNGPGAYVWWTPAVVPSPDQQMLYIVHADEDKLTTVDFARQSATTVEIGPARSWLEQLLTLGAGVAHAKTLDGTGKHAVLSSDGTRLYVVGETSKSTQDANQEWQFTQTPLNLQVVAVATGVEIAQLETQATEISLSPDGAQVFLRGWDKIGAPWTDVLDTGRLEVVAHLIGRYIIPARQVDGQPILLGSDTHTGHTTLTVLEAQSLREIQVWSIPAYAAWLSPLWNLMQW